MKKPAIMTIACAALVAMSLSGCPGDNPFQFVLTVENNSADIPIDSIKIRELGGGYGSNELAEPLQPGDSEDFVLDAPFRVLDEEGTSYQVLVEYEVPLLKGLFEADGEDEGTFRRAHKNEKHTWDWTPGSEPDVSVD